MILELGSNLYHLLIFLIVAWTIMRFLIAITKMPTVSSQTQKPNKKEEEGMEFTR
jgi:large-conductance mechanosensitive channel